jgi:hypothetical protein
LRQVALADNISVESGRKAGAAEQLCVLRRSVTALSEAIVIDFADSLQLFLSGFTARELAEPLPSFDDTAKPSAVRDAIFAQHLEVVGIRNSGIVEGWMSRADATNDTNDTQPLVGRQFDESSVISDAASLHDVVQGLNSAPCLFVRSIGHVSGLIRRSDLQKPAMRMWLFGLVTISELRVTRLIDEYCPHDAWQTYLSNGRLQKAIDLQHERRRQGQQPSLLDCLQFADKGQIVARDERLRRHTRFASKREVEDFVKALQDLRNNLAHSQDLSGNWEIIHDLATNLHRIVLGPAGDAAPSTLT